MFWKNNDTLNHITTPEHRKKSTRELRGAVAWVGRNVGCSSEIFSSQILLHSSSQQVPSSANFTLRFTLLSPFHGWCCSFQENQHSKGWHCQCSLFSFHCSFICFSSILFLYWVHLIVGLIYFVGFYWKFSNFFYFLYFFFRWGFLHSRIFLVLRLGIGLWFGVFLVMGLWLGLGEFSWAYSVNKVSIFNLI